MGASRKKVFDGRLLKVFTSRKILPNGQRANFEEIAHPGASLVIPFVKSKIVCIRQYRAVIDRYIWELPAGTLARGESPHACARRETTEETGYTVKSLKKLGYIYTTPGFCNEKIHIFSAECGKKIATEKDADEIINVRLLSKKEIKALFLGGRINDSKTIAALSFAGIL